MKNFYGENEIILFHGSAYGDEILEKGFDNVPGCWDCSEFNQAYFYEYKRWCRCEGYDEDDEYSLPTIINRANEQGQLQNAFSVSPRPVTFVLEIHLPEEFDEYIEEDTSCENMSHYGAVQVSIPVINKWMKKGKCKIIFHEFTFAVKCSLMYITGMYNNPNAEGAIDSLPSFEREALKSLAKGEFNEDFYDTCISYLEPTSSKEIDFLLCTKLNYNFD